MALAILFATFQMHLVLSLGCFVFEFLPCIIFKHWVMLEGVFCFHSSQGTQLEHLSKILQMLCSVFPVRFVPFERQVCVSYYKYRLICSDPLAENLRYRKFSERFSHFPKLLAVVGFTKMLVDLFYVFLTTYLPPSKTRGYRFPVSRYFVAEIFPKKS